MREHYGIYCYILVYLVFYIYSLFRFHWLLRMESKTEKRIYSYWLGIDRLFNYVFSILWSHICHIDNYCYGSKVDCLECRKLR